MASSKSPKFAPGQNCSRCTAPLAKGKFKCTACGAWNVTPPTKKAGAGDGTMLLDDVKTVLGAGYKTGPWDRNFAEPHRVPDDAAILLGGEPGAGKSTVALQLAFALAEASKHECLYLPAEENETQVRERAVRLVGDDLKKRIRVVNRNELGETPLDSVVKRYRPAGVIVDSLQGFSEELSVQLSLCSQFRQLSKDTRIPHIIITRVNKDGDLAGLQDLQHEVDICVLIQKTPKDNVVLVREVRGGKPWGRPYEIEEMREFYTKKSRYGPAGGEVTTRYQMTGRGLIQVEIVEEDDDEEEAA